MGGLDVLAHRRQQLLVLPAAALVEVEARRRPQQVGVGAAAAVAVADLAQDLDHLPVAAGEERLGGAEELAGVTASRTETQLLPAASLSLIQAVGRLLRSETDSGRVTILDRRLVNRGYGKRLMNSLPPFSRLLME